GYSIYDLAEHCEFEEVAFLLVYGSLPTAAQLATYKDRLKKYRDLPDALKDVLALIPAAAHPMDVMRTATSYMGTIKPEGETHDQHEVTDRLLALYPAALVYWWHYTHSGKAI